jgi:hypothetical protein
MYLHIHIGRCALAHALDQAVVHDKVHSSVASKLPCNLSVLCPQWVLEFLHVPVWTMSLPKHRQSVSKSTQRDWMHAPHYVRSLRPF